MHSSRMCTARFNSHLYRGVSRGVYAQGGCPPPGPRDRHPWKHTPAPLYAGIHDLCPLHAGIHTPCKQNDRQTCVKTLPCPKLRLRAVINAKIISITTYPHQARHRLLHSRRMFCAQDLHMADMSSVRS